MTKPWLKDGRKVYEDGKPVYCDVCPCEEPGTGCQCILHYFAVYCLSDRTGNPRWLTVDEVIACHPTAGIIGVTDYIYYISGSEGDGCFDLGGVELPAGWEDWCNDGSYDCTPGPEDPCPGKTILCLAIRLGKFDCSPCDQTMTDCERPNTFPDLPADPTLLVPCGV